MNPRTPKTLKIEDLRRLLGSDQVDQLIGAIKGQRGAPSRRARISRDQLDRTVALVNGESESTSGRGWIGTVPVFRAYFAESAQRRRRLTEWAEEKRAELDQQPAAPRRRRRRNGQSPDED